MMIVPLRGTLYSSTIHNSSVDEMSTGTRYCQIKKFSSLKLCYVCFEHSKWLTILNSQSEC